MIGTARVWDATTGQPITPLLKHENGGDCPWAAFSPDGRRVITVVGGPYSTGSSSRIWDLGGDELLSGDLILIGQLLCGSQVDASGGLSPIESDSIFKRWKSFHDEHSRQFICDPQSVLAWHRREADHSEAIKAWTAAIWHLNQLIPLEPGDWSLLARRGRAFEKLGQWDRAVEDLSKSIELRPDEEALRVDRARMFEQMKRWDQAVIDYSKVIALNPGKTQYWN